jgi:uncharacterized membrane protein YeaQ/YmgE (transglycosylase-associated protein family)
MESSHDISDLLRKALLVATKLDLKEFQSWISKELNGYENVAEIPDYRKIYGEVKVYNSVQGRYIPFIVDNAEIMNTIQQVNVCESIDSIRHAVELSKKNDNILSYPFPPEITNILMSWQNSRFQAIPTQLVGANQLIAIIEKVRTRILEWSLNLEASGILGENLTFTQEEKRMAELNSGISINHFQGILGDIHGGAVSQTMSIQITSGNFESLAKYLTSKGISFEDIKELEQAVSQDPEQPVKGKFGDNVSKWMGRMVTKAAEGSWDISVSLAANLLSTALVKFYGG